MRIYRNAIGTLFHVLVHNGAASREIFNLLSAQSDQRICYSIFGKNYNSTCCMQIFNILASLCSCACSFEPSRRQTFSRSYIYAFLASGDFCLCKQFGPRSGPTERRSRSGSKLFDTLIVFLKEFSKKVYFEKKQKKPSDTCI